MSFERVYENPAHWPRDCVKEVEIDVLVSVPSGKVTAGYLLGKAAMEAAGRSWYAMATVTIGLESEPGVYATMKVEIPEWSTPDGQDADTIDDEHIEPVLSAIEDAVCRYVDDWLDDYEPWVEWQAREDRALRYELRTLDNRGSRPLGDVL